MPMTGSGLSALLKPVIISEIQAVFDIVDATKLQDFAQAMADAIGPTVVQYIQANALVTSTVVVTSVSGVQTGSGVSGPGVGTATGTIT